MIDEVSTLGAPVEVVDWLRAHWLIDSGRPAEALPILRNMRTVRLGSTLELDGSLAVASLMRAATAAGEFDEALACAIQLVGHGDVGRYGEAMLRLWGDQPSELLAELLDGVVGPRRREVAAALSGLPGKGAEVAAFLAR